MRIAVLGTGMVGRAHAGRLAELGHEATMGTRDVERAMASTDEARDGTGTLSQWLGRTPDVRLATFAAAAAGAELVINATAGQGSLEALRQAGAGNLDGTVVLDVSNPLDHSVGFPPRLSVCNDDSVAEGIQREFPAARVVKSLNMVTAAVMVNPGLLAGDEHAAFVAGNDAAAKEKVTGLLRDGFGWKHVIDLGDLTAARGMEMYVTLWIRLMGALRTPMFNVAVVT